MGVDMTLTEIKTDREHYWVDSLDRRQGESKHWDSNGQLWKHCHYVNGEAHGESKEWHSNGQLRGHCHYVNGERHGESKEWHSNGELREHVLYVEGKKLDIDISGISDKDKFVLGIRYQVEWL
jgi:antitoxin component YwqK of YwqJK toxin-antitoxin module